MSVIIIIKALMLPAIIMKALMHRENLLKAKTWGLKMVCSIFCDRLVCFDHFMPAVKCALTNFGDEPFTKVITKF
jgi:hypothetical protein